MKGRPLIPGQAQGELLLSHEPLSFWGGYNQHSGEIIDRRHPLSGQMAAGKVLAIPFSRGSSTTTAVLLEAILKGIGHQGYLMMVGSGDRDYERWLTAVAARHANFFFLNGYSDRLARALYASGDLFLMPSSYEPCGLSQMLAMRAGQPCVVHAVGGLKDTVRHAVNGFTFEGLKLEEQVDRLVETTLAAVAIKRGQPEVWQRVCREAAATRFTWSDTAERYLTDLYPGVGADASGGAGPDQFSGSIR